MFISFGFFMKRIVCFYITKPFQILFITSLTRKNARKHRFVELSYRFYCEKRANVVALPMTS